MNAALVLMLPRVKALQFVRGVRVGLADVVGDEVVVGVKRHLLAWLQKQPTSAAGTPLSLARA